jgi:hypothetical protein
MNLRKMYSCSGLEVKVYKVIFLSSINVPKSHTCFNQLDLPYPDKIDSKQELFDIFMKTFIFKQHSAFGMA